MEESGQLEEYLPKIRNIMTFRYLTDQECRKMLSIARIIKFNPREKIIQQGDISQHFYVLIEGSAEISVREPDGREVVVCSIGEGEVFGESAIFLAVKRTASVISSMKAVVLRIHRKNMISFFREFPQAGNKILMLIIYSLLNKLSLANQELAYEKQASINLDFIDNYVQESLLES